MRVVTTRVVYRRSSRRTGAAPSHSAAEKRTARGLRKRVKVFSLVSLLTLSTAAYSQAGCALEPFPILALKAATETEAKYKDISADSQKAISAPSNENRNIDGICSFTATLFGSNKRFQALHKWVPIPLGAKDEHNGKGAFYCRMKDHSVVTWPVLVAAKGVGIGVGGSSTKKFPFFTRTTEEEVSIGAVGIGVTEGLAQLVGKYRGLDSTASAKIGIGRGVETGLGIYVRETPAQPDFQLSDLVLPLAGRVKKPSGKVASETALVYSEVTISVDPDSFFADP